MAKVKTASLDESDTGELDWRVVVVRRARLGAYGSDVAGSSASGNTDIYLCKFARWEANAIVITRGRLALDNPNEPLPAWIVLPAHSFYSATITYIGKED